MSARDEFIERTLLLAEAAGRVTLHTNDPHIESTARWRAAHPEYGAWENDPDICMFSGCGNTIIDTRGPVVTRDGRYWKACTPHWEAIMAENGRQVEDEQRERNWETGPDADREAQQ